MTLAFISYSREDGRDIAEIIYENLRTNGCNPWIDFKNLEPGVDWDDEIDKALENCDAVIVVVTPLAVTSINVKAEWKPALEDGKLIIPVVRQPVRIPRYLRLFQYVDFSENVDKYSAINSIIRLC